MRKTIYVNLSLIVLLFNTNFMNKLHGYMGDVVGTFRRCGGYMGDVVAKFGRCGGYCTTEDVLAT